MTYPSARCNLHSASDMIHVSPPLVGLIQSVYSEVASEVEWQYSHNTITTLRDVSQLLTKDSVSFR